MKLTNVKELMAKLTVPTSVFVAFCTKITFFGSSVSDAVAIFAIAGVYGYNLHLNKKLAVTTDEMKEQISRLENQISSVQMGINMKKSHEASNKKTDTSIPNSAASTKRFF